MNSDILITFDNTRVADVKIASGEGVLKRGAMLGKVTATGKYRLWNSQHSDGSEVFVAVLGCDVDARSADAKAFAYVEGSFDSSKLVCGYGSVPKGVFLNGNIVIK